MKTKISIALILGILLLSTGIGLTTVSAAEWPNLPATAVQLSVEDGTNTYFDSTLSSVPAGYSVHNGLYPGWCIDNTENMERTTNHDVILYSSLTPPTALSGIEWGAINYILNHKQGTMLDVQNAIWYFTNGKSVSGTAQTMVTEALANLNYDPSTICGATLAIICYDDNPSNNVQNTIIEIEKSCIPGLSPGFWKHNVGVYLTEIGTLQDKHAVNGAYSDPTNSPVVNKESMSAWLGGLGLDLEALYNGLNTKGGGAEGAATRVNAANVFNALAGLSDYED